MSAFQNLLEQEPDALERYLLDHARRDAAPEAARARACAAVALVTSVIAAPTAAAHTAASGTAKLAAGLALKWGAAGLAAGSLVLGASLAIQEVVSAPQAQSDNVPRRATQNSSPDSSPAAHLAAGAADLPRPIAGEDLPELPRRAVEGATRAPDVSLLDSKSPLASRASGASVVQGLPPSGSFAAIDSSRLARELQLLEQARVALARSSPAAALRLLDSHDREFASASGTLQAEAAALRVEVASKSGQRALAQLLAQSFLARYPESPLGARVRAFADAAGSAANKP